MRVRTCVDTQCVLAGGQQGNELSPFFLLPALILLVAYLVGTCIPDWLVTGKSLLGFPFHIRSNTKHMSWNITSQQSFSWSCLVYKIQFLFVECSVKVLTS